jgi:hypothetical protein
MIGRSDYSLGFIHYSGKIELAGKIYGMCMNFKPTTNGVGAYAFFQWHRKKNLALAFRCFKVLFSIEIIILILVAF